MEAGDKNTKFFHLRASQRRKRNRISKLRKPDGLFSENEEEMGAMATQFYRTLYASEGTMNMDRVLETVPAKVTTVMNEGLLAPFQRDEIKESSFPDVPYQGTGPRWLAGAFLPASLGDLWR